MISMAGSKGYEQKEVHFESKIKKCQSKKVHRSEKKIQAMA